jgi:hypothetical protein
VQSKAPVLQPVLRGGAEEHGQKIFLKEKMKLSKTFAAFAFAVIVGASTVLAGQSCCVKAKAKGKECDHECCVKAHKEHKLCEKCQKDANNCCDKAIAQGKECPHSCCKEAAKEHKICEKCNKPDGKKEK